MNNQEEQNKKPESQVSFNRNLNQPNDGIEVPLDNNEVQPADINNIVQPDMGSQNIQINQEDTQNVQQNMSQAIGQNDLQNSQNGVYNIESKDQHQNCKEKPQVTQQQIECHLIAQADRSMDSSSNLNLDSGTLRNQEGNPYHKNEQPAQDDFFKNFDYDKNQSKIKDDVEHYPEPPSFLINNQPHQEHAHQNQIAMQPQDSLHESAIMQQNSELIEESDQKTVKRSQGLPQPYDSTVYYDFKDFPDNKWEPFKDQQSCPPNSFLDARSIENNGEKMERLLKGGTTKPILFDLQNTWLKGEQYAHILQNQDRYCQVFNIQKYDCKQHPESIYIDPQDGLLYFVEGATIGSDFGFPRLGIRKRFKWKKMNFTTDLPKRDPLVSYIVASAVKCEKFFPGSNDDGPVYRMHAVILKKRDMSLQLPSEGGSSMTSPNKIEAQLSQDTNNNDKQYEQQPRSLHGRVLQKSQKLKASQRMGPPSQKNNSSNTNKNQPSGSPVDDFGSKNYILCHVRRVMGKRDEEFDSENNQAEPDSAVKKDGPSSNLEVQRQQSSKIPNKGKSKLDQIPLQFSDADSSPQKDKKIPNLKMFHGMSLEQIKKMKVGPDGKPLSLYKIKKYILPHHKMLSKQQKQLEESNKLEYQSSSQRRESDDQIQISTQQQQSRGRKRKNQTSIQELDEDIEQDLNESKDDIKFDNQKSHKDRQKKDLQTYNQDSHTKPINVERMDESQSNKQETFNNSQRVNDNNETQNQNINQILDHNKNNSNTSNNQMNLANQNPFQLEQALALNNLLGNNNNNFGLNGLGMQNPFNNVNGLMLNQLGALSNLGGQNQNGLNQLLNNPTNIGLNSDLALQNQLLGLQGNLGLNNFGSNYNLSNINNLLGVNQLQGMNINGLLNQNQLSNLNNLQLQQNLLNQNGPGSQLLSKLQDQVKLNNLNNELLLLNQQNMNQGSNQQKKRDQKAMRKYDSLKLPDQIKNTISPNLMAQKDSNSFLGPMIGNQFLNNANIGGSLKRKQTSEQPNPFMDEPINDLLRHCEKEYTRRLSGQLKLNIDDNQKSQIVSPKSNNLSTMMKSPNIQPLNHKRTDQLNHHIQQSNQMYQKRRQSVVSNFGRDRLNSKVSAFKKYDQRHGDEKDIMTSPLIKGKQGEPSFGVESIQETKSIQANKFNAETSNQSMSKKNDSKLGSQTSKMNKSKSNNNTISQQILQMQLNQQYQQLLNQLPGTNIDQLQMSLNGNINQQLQNMSQDNSFANMNQSFNQNLQGLNNSLGVNQVKPGNNGNNSQNMLLQQQQLPQLLYHQQQYQMLMNQIVSSQIGMGNGNQNFNSLDLLQQQQLLLNNQDKQDQNKMNGGRSKNNNDNQPINQQINIIQNSKIQPVLNGLILGQLGQSQDNQQRKDSFQKNKNTGTQSPKVRSRNNSQNAQFLNQLKIALAPNPQNNGLNQHQDQIMANNNHPHGSSLIIPQPSKQNSHRNSNVSNQNVLPFGARKSTDFQYNKHKFSITGAVIKNNPNMYNPRLHAQSKINQQSQLSNTSGKGGTQSCPVSQENRQVSSPDRNFDSSQSQKQELDTKRRHGDSEQFKQLNLTDPAMQMPQQQRSDLMKSPGIISGIFQQNQMQVNNSSSTFQQQLGGRQINRDNSSSQFGYNKYNGTNMNGQQNNQSNQNGQYQSQQQEFMAPISRHSSQMLVNQSSSNGGQNGYMGMQEPNSGARISDDQRTPSSALRQQPPSSK